MPHRMRLDRARELARELELDALLVVSPANIFYFTGFKGAPRLLVPSDGRPILLTPGVDLAAAQQHFSGAEVEVRHVRVGQKPDDVLLEALRELRVRKLGFDSLPLATYRRLASELGEEELVEASERVWELRKVKDEREIAAIRRACEIASKVMAFVPELLAPGVRELEVAGELERELRLAGSEEHPFSIIVASGPNSALPHARASGRELREGDLVVVDLGATCGGYVSDMTRTFVVGRPEPWQEKVYAAVREAQLTAIEALRAGVRACDVDAVARGLIDKAGYADYFVHSLGHGVGIEVHEQPRLAPGVEEELRAGYVITVEPGIYLPDKGGVMIEDTVLVLEEGREVLTGPSAPSELAG